MHRIIFVCTALLSVWLTFGSLGPLLSRIMQAGIDWWTALLDHVLQKAGAVPLLHDLVIDGICAGVGSVLSFLPIIAVLFFCLACWEQSGVLAMLSHLWDRPLRRLGLSGASAAPLLLGFGCSVPAIMEAEHLKTQQQKQLTIFLIPFLSCSAKLPLYAMIAAAFFQSHRLLLTGSLYLCGILLGAGLLRLQRTIPAACRCSRCRHTRSSRPAPDPARTPPALRLPSIPAVCMQAWTSSKAYMQKIFSVVLLASCVIWFLEHFTPGLSQASAPQESILASIGRFTAPFFAPLGFGDWRAAAALLTGLAAKEAIVSTLAVLAEAQSPQLTLDAMLPQVFTPLSAYAFAVFCLLYMPCVATLAAVKKTLNSWTRAFVMLLTRTGLAWLAAHLIWQTGSVLLRFVS